MSSTPSPAPKARRSFTYLLFALAIGLVAFGAAAMPRLRARAVTDPPVEPPPPRSVAKTSNAPRMEVVFALDTTGSMSGLLDGAKRKVWSLVDFISSAEPQPEVRIGLVAYRDVGDAYVTRFYDLSDDVDGVFKTLSSFQAGGGGDTPEHVSKALYDAVERTTWSEGKNVIKLVYLVGDAPPHVDYDDGYDYKKIAADAARKGIHLNAIRCGDDSDTERFFAEIASVGQGQFASIAQSGGVAIVGTPYDEKLASLNHRLMDTTMGFGLGGLGLRGKIEAMMAAPASVNADRAAYAGKKRMAISGAGKDDLVNLLTEGGSGAVAAVPASSLPASLARLSVGERTAAVVAKKAEREHVLDEINLVAAERTRFLSSKPAGPRSDGFDDRVRKSLVEQSAGVLKF